MARTTTGNLGTHLSQEVNTTCRILQITRPDGYVVRYTDHDEDVMLVSEATPATGLFVQPETDGGPQKAEAIFSITKDENAANDETVTIGSTVYTFKTALSAGPTVPYEVLIGADLLESLENLLAAINGDAGEGTIYSVDTDPHPDVDAELIDITNPQIITLPSGGGGGSDDQVISSTGPGVTRFGNVSNIANAFDGNVNTRAVGQNTQANRDGIYVGLSFVTPRYISRVVIKGKSPSFGQNFRSRRASFTSTKATIQSDYNTAKSKS